MSRPTVRLGRVAGALAVALALTTALAAAAEAQPVTGDFDPASTEWNGLSDFVDLGLEADIILQPTQTLDYAALDPSRPLVIVSPGPELDAGALQRFVGDGGRVLLFDDFGGSERLLADFSDPIERVAPLPPGVAIEYLNGNPELPVLATPGRHALLEGAVDRIVANHAAGFVSTLPAVVYYAGGELGFAYDLTIGQGKLVVIGDSSLTINLMLPIADNRNFVRNALDYVCPTDDPCSADLLVGGFGVEGSYGEVEETTTTAALEDGIEKVNEALRKLDEFVPERRLMRVMTLLLMVGLVLFGLTVFPSQPARFLSIRFRPPPRLLPESEFERNLREFRSGTEGNFALPLAILRDEFEHLLLREVYPEAERRPDAEARYRPGVVNETASAYATRVADTGSDAWRSRQRQLTALMKTLARIPGHTQNYIDPGPRWSEKHLTEVHAQCLDILGTLGVLEEYEQRTRRR